MLRNTFTAVIAAALLSFAGAMLLTGCGESVTAPGEVSIDSIHEQGNSANLQARSTSDRPVRRKTK